MINRNEIKERAKGMFMGNYWLNVALFAIFGAVAGGASGFSGMGSGSSSFMNNFKDSIPPAVMAVIGIVVMFAALIGIGYGIFVAGPLTVSSARAGLNVYDGNRPSFKDIIYCFKDGRYWKCVGGMALSGLFTALAALVVMIPIAIIAVIAAVGIGDSSSISEGAAISGYVGIGIVSTLLALIPTIIVGLGLSQTPYIIAEEGLSGMAAIKGSWEVMRGHKWELFVFRLSFFGWAMLTVITFGIVGVFYVNPYMSISYAGYYRELTGGANAAVEVI